VDLLQSAFKVSVLLTDHQTCRTQYTGKLGFSLSSTGSAGRCKKCGVTPHFNLLSFRNALSCSQICENWLFLLQDGPGFVSAAKTAHRAFSGLQWFCSPFSVLSLKLPFRGLGAEPGFPAPCVRRTAGCDACPVRRQVFFHSYLALVHFFSGFNEWS